MQPQVLIDKHKREIIQEQRKNPQREGRRLENNDRNTQTAVETLDKTFQEMNVKIRLIWGELNKVMTYR